MAFPVFYERVLTALGPLDVIRTQLMGALISAHDGRYAESVKCLAASEQGLGMLPDMRRYVQKLVRELVSGVAQ